MYICNNQKIKTNATEIVRKEQQFQRHAANRRYPQ